MTKHQFFHICRDWMQRDPTRLLVVECIRGRIELNDVGDRSVVGYPIFTPLPNSAIRAPLNVRLRQAELRYERWLRELLTAEYTARAIVVQATGPVHADDRPYRIRPLVWSQPSADFSELTESVVGPFRLRVMRSPATGYNWEILSAGSLPYQCFDTAPCISIDAGKLRAEVSYRMMLRELLVPGPVMPAVSWQPQSLLRELDLS